MTAAARAYGRVFNQFAGDYDRHRPVYPNKLIDRVCELAGLAPGDCVLELGCGSGQLTRALVARGLNVTALDPGERMIELAAGNVNARTELINARFEDAALQDRLFRAVFSAAAFHWIDPDVSWVKAAETLHPGGTLALIQYCGLIEDDTRAAHESLMSALRKTAPEAAAQWPRARDLATITTGVERRGTNISEAWSWLGGYDLSRASARDLFDGVQAAYAPTVMEHTAAQLTAAFRTTAIHHRLSAAQQAAFEREVNAVAARFGPLVRSSTVAVAVTARRAQANV